MDISLVIKILVGWIILCLATALAWSRWFRYQREQDIVDAHYRENKL